jgi:hypothetical protein
MKKESRGRKPIPSELKKIPLTIYLKQSEVEALGGAPKLKDDILFYTKTKLKIHAQTI